MRAVTHPPHIDGPRPRLVVCADCGGTGYDYEYYNCPLEQITKHRKVPCATCHGEGAYEKPAANGASARPAGVPVLSTGRDASPPSRMPRDAVATADQSRSTLVGSDTHTVLRKCSTPMASEEVQAVFPAPKKAPPGTSLADKVVDALTVVAGLAVFSMIALVLMVIA